MKILIPIVILDTMWGNEHAKLFQINPKNRSGYRLHKIISSRFLVGNSCDGIAPNAKTHGTPSPEYLQSVFEYATEKGFEPNLLIIGGKVAQKTYMSLRCAPKCRTLFMPHPAARFWTKQMEADAINGINSDLHMQVLSKDGWNPIVLL